jgi:uncharacterized membrane protein HdeD (DUF308 family)
MATSKIEAVQQATPWWVLLLEGIGALIIGILLLLQPEMTTTLLVLLLGLYWLFSGILSIVRIFQDRSMWGLKLAAGILGIIAGLLVLQFPLGATIILQATVVVILGIIGLVVGLISIIEAFQGGGWGLGILGVVSIIFGFLLIFNPLQGAITLPLVLGVIGIIGGVAIVIIAFRARS